MNSLSDRLPPYVVKLVTVADATADGVLQYAMVVAWEEPGYEAESGASGSLW